MKLLRTLTVALLSALVAVSCSIATTPVGQYDLKSPDNGLVVTLDNSSGAMRYTLSSGDEELIGSSEISILRNKTVLVTGLTAGSSKSVWTPTWGQYSKIESNYRSYHISLDVEGREAELELRIFNDGVGMRYRVANYDKADKAQLFVEYNIVGGDKYWWSRHQAGYDVARTLDQMVKAGRSESYMLPVVVENKEGKHLSFLESDLFMTKGFSGMQMRFNPKAEGFYSQNGVEAFEGDDLLTPWRVILVGDSAGDLVTSTTPLNLATECQLDDTSWIKPGKTLWDWRVHGYTAPDGFQYDINTESYMRFIDFAAKYDVDYFLIDDAWYSLAEEGKFHWTEGLDLQRVIDYAAEKSVDLLLYYDRRHGEYGDEGLFKYYSSLGMKGMKYGFMGSKVPFTRNAVRESAKEKLIIDFHDGPVPMTGLERTFPNAITREYCHAQLDGLRCFTPEMFIKMALVNAVHGPLDMNNGNFDITGINRGERFKGPRELDSYLTTVVAEAARTVIINSGLVCIPDAPENYEAKMDLFEFVLRAPVGRWDDTKVINAVIGESITTIRRSGDEWFVASNVCQKGGTLDIPTDFLERGKEYAVTYYEDGEDADCHTNPESYRVVEGRIKGGETIVAKMARGGGHAAWIRSI